MKLNEEYHNILRYTRRLKVKSYDLRSKLTALVLFTEESENLTQEQKNCILQICETIGKKNDELIYSEKQLEEVLDELFPDSTRAPYTHSALER
ncbi:hypothetical protein GCM10009122_34760 [Fulvivirga kasyanovii]|uniref:Uncharacterized protein n=1 Tax=Fulvivirga kasyanovii TaxID=396812 RepID=A0ABW9RIJ1_9BACT|nr:MULTISPECIES: hypothetical protein [Fulvivirga]MTI23818.1 hypothetical protein [Fulvivirga kasyanovii]UII31022.1 hypothetical protein LVD17_22270 [Fulvivirga ulvae]